MRRALPLLSLLAVVACAPATVEQPPAPPVDWAVFESRSAPAPAPIKPSERRNQVIEAYVEALRSRGFLGLGALLDEMAHFQGGAIETHGRDRVVAAHQTALGSFDKPTFVTRRIWLASDAERMQVLEWVMTGEQGGKSATVSGLTLLWTKPDGSISDIHVHLAEPAAPRSPEPQGPETVVATTETKRAQENAALMRTLVRAIQDGKEPDFVVPFTHDEQEHARAWFRAARKALSQVDTVVYGAWGAEDSALVEYAVSGRQQDRIVRVVLVDVARIRDGKITQLWRYGG